MNDGQLPDRLAQALIKRSALEQQQIYFAPVRHHSPACSYALRQLIHQVKPTHVLIEAPASFVKILEHLHHQQTQPPIAILCQTQIGSVTEPSELNTDDSGAKCSTVSAFYPFCSYSPEWQAIQLAKSYNATIQFIDLPWTEQAKHKADDKQSISLLSETYLKHSQYIQHLMRKLHCRDHDEVWEHLFELQNYDDIANWQKFLLDTFIWCAMARLDYSPASLEAEGSSQREQYMLTAIGQLKQTQPSAKIVVVTGGFHTLALLEGLWQEKLILPTKSALTQFNQQQKKCNQDQMWLIRYSFDRLDALNGYASGMPSPAFYQSAWQTMLYYEQSSDKTLPTQHYRQSQTVHMLVDIVEKLRRQPNFDEVVGFVPLRSACEQAYLLADLRCHYGPGRYDLLDSLQSSFIKGSVSDTRDEFWQIVRNCLSGNLLGRIPTDIALPPLVNDVYATLKKYRFKLDDTQLKITHIDLYRNANHVQRSRLLHLLAFLNIGFARRLDGPDYINGLRMNLMFEDWQYAWTPMVEAALIELAQQGMQLEQIASQKLQVESQKQAESGLALSSNQAVQTIIQAALMGLESYAIQLINHLSYVIEGEQNLESLINCGHRLLYLWQGQQFLQLNVTSGLLILLAKIPNQAFFLFETLKQQPEDQQQQNIKLLLSLRDLLNNLPQPLDVQQFKQDFYHNLQRLQPYLHQTPLISGAIDSISYLESFLSQLELEAKIKSVFGATVKSEQAIGYLLGIMQCTPELIDHSSILLDSLDQLLVEWPTEQFIAILPNLRYAFAQLTPKQNASLAQKIAQKYGLASNDLQLQQYDFSENELQSALALELSITEHLEQQHLINWFKQ